MGHLTSLTGLVLIGVSVPHLYTYITQPKLSYIRQSPIADRVESWATRHRR